MNLEKLLAENMLRFGTKNLVVSNIKPYLLEQTKVPSAIYSKYIAESTVAQLPTIIKTYDPTKGAIKITDGNPWLATQRAMALQQFLISRFQGQFRIPFDSNAAKIIKTAVPGPGDENQYMKATIKAKLRKPPRKQDPYPYSILYNFYDIDGIPHILVSKMGKGAPEILDSTNGDDTWIRRFNRFLPNITNGKLVKQYVGGASATGPNKQETAYGIMIPILGGYSAKKKGRLLFSDLNAYNEMKKYIAQYTDVIAIDAETVNNPKATQARFTSSPGGDGNLIFGDLGTGRAAAIVAGADSGKQITIKRMEPSKIGTLPGEILPGEEEKWYPIAEILYPGLFPDNLITIKADKYKEIFDKIQAKITELADEDYEAVEMTAEIQGFASTDNANNRCPQGYKPDHSWGGPVTIDKWISL